jgi:hypothetical protein
MRITIITTFSHPSASNATRTLLLSQEIFRFNNDQDRRAPPSGGKQIIKILLPAKTPRQSLANGGKWR